MNKGINLYAGVCKNFKTVLLQFMLKLTLTKYKYVTVETIYIDKFILLSQHQIPAEKLVFRFKKD